ncbi:hypothetical protein F5Y10DRAFT_258558 [Nemania abortiva]|nr:hypothetical protein F5Y10DRAFT_258558 [Nemania abortiva]
MDAGAIRELQRRLEEEKAGRIAAERRAEEAEKKVEATTLVDYINGCHQLIFTQLRVEPNKRRRTTGTIPPPYSKLYPRCLMPWKDFAAERTKILSTVYQGFNINEQLFDNTAWLETLGTKTLAAPIADEKMLETFLRFCVEDPVRCIIHELSRSTTLSDKLLLENGISFENHYKAIDGPYHSINNRKPKQPLPQAPQAPPPPDRKERPRTPDPIKDPPKLNPDQICVYHCQREGEQLRKAIAISEYKPPHKLTLPQLRAGLKETNMIDVVANNKIPNEKEAKFVHYATVLVASAITQTYHYMVKAGLAYGLLTTGQGIVFLKINWKNPETVYYHLADPIGELSSLEGDIENIRYHSAVAQYLAFHLLALADYSDIKQDVRVEAISKLRTWKMDFRNAASTVPDEQWEPPPTSSYVSYRKYQDVDRTIPRRSRRLNPTDDEHGSRPAIRRDEKSSDEDDVSPSVRQSERLKRKHAEQHSGSRKSRCAHKEVAKERGGHARNRDEFEGKPHGDLEYCTQKCILGLVGGDTIDPDCPNLKLHQHRNNQGSVDTNTLHPISHSKFLEQLSEQLGCTLDYGITSLDIRGARGAIFKVTLLDYGYTFISKGTTEADKPHLEHEARVYKRLKDIQGVYVPVFLGTIDLQPLGRAYFYDFDVDIEYLCFLSWGGLSLRYAQHLDKPNLQTMAEKAMGAIHQKGVVHKDPRYENVLFNPQTERIMLIDFERSQLVNTFRPTLVPIEHNKRRQVQRRKGQKLLVGGSSGCDLPPWARDGFLADLTGIREAF